MSETSDELLRGYPGPGEALRGAALPAALRAREPGPPRAVRAGQGPSLESRRTDIAWHRFDPAAYDAPVREAARLVWSRRAWGAYPGLGENTALLIRFCLESGAAGMDAKLFLSFRPAEEAKHLEACFLFAERLGGYERRSRAEAIARASNHPFAQMALDPDLPRGGGGGRARLPRRPARPQPLPEPSAAEPRRDRRARSCG